MRYKLTIAYDGGPYRGWQSQLAKEGVRPTLQDTLEKAVASLIGPADDAGKIVRVHASGRTDTGVHAVGQVAHFQAPESCRLTEWDWHRALNAMLPPTLRVMRCEQVADDFHARFDALGKWYRYRLYTGEVLPPLEFGRMWHLYGCVDIGGLCAGARLFEGKHDFTSYSALRGEVDEGEQDKERTIHRLRVECDGDTVTLDFYGDGFLYKMVRMITGALARVARGRETVERLQELLEKPSPLKPGWQAPPQGLTLMEVYYDQKEGPPWWRA
jgi:tRNA pseudouridine38-40 synthase